MKGPIPDPVASSGFYPGNTPKDCKSIQMAEHRIQATESKRSIEPEYRIRGLNIVARCIYNIYFCSVNRLYIPA